MGPVEVDSTWIVRLEDPGISACVDPGIPADAGTVTLSVALVVSVEFPNVARVFTGPSVP
jgi:hypothetical protein